MDTLFELIPSELIIIILSYSDKENIDKLSGVSRLDKLLKEKSTWVFILISEYRYEYQLLRDINEDSIENIKDFYYRLKEGGVYYKPHVRMKIRNVSYPYLVKILLYNNYPRIYNLLSQLINSKSYINLQIKLSYLDTYEGLYEYLQTGTISNDSDRYLNDIVMKMPYLWIYLNNDKINFNGNFLVLSQLFVIQDYFKKYYLDEQVYNNFIYDLLYKRLTLKTIKNIANFYIEIYKDESLEELRDRLYSVLLLLLNI